MLEAGIRGEQSVAVTSENTAKTMGSGTLDVFATPALVALAEKTCWMSVAAALDEGCGTVGTRLELEHSAPHPCGHDRDLRERADRCGGPQAGVQGLPARRERPRGRRRARAVHHQQRQVCRKGREQKKG